MLRRRLLQGLFAGGCIFSSIDGSRHFRPAEAATQRTNVRLGYVGNVCEAATMTAPRSESFERNGLEAQLISFASETGLIAALGDGSVDAASMNLPALLEPLENRCAVRVVAGLHAGCLRVLARNDVFLNWIGQLRGTIVATDRLHGSSMKLLSAIMRRQGVDPRRDVAWRVYDKPGLESALDARAITCVAASDPLGYALIEDRKAQPYPIGPTGGFFCGADLAPGHHCFLVLHAGLVDRRPAVAAALTRAYLDITSEIGRATRPVELAETFGPFVVNLNESLAMLSSYEWTPSTDFVLQELEITAHDFRRAGLLQPATDPQALAERSFADVLHA